MRKLKCVFTVLGLLVALFALVACNANRDEGNGFESRNGLNASDRDGGAATPLGTATGRYVEREITPPIDGFMISLVTESGGLVAFDEGLLFRYDSDDRGLTWMQSPGPGRGDERFANVRTAAILPDGGLLVYLPEAGMTTVAPDGTMAHFPVATIDAGIADGDEFIVSMIQVLEGGRLLLTYEVDWFARLIREGGMEGFQFLPIGEVVDEDEEADEYGEYEDEEETGGGGGATFRVQGSVSAFGGGGGGMIFGGGGRTTAVYDLNTGAQLDVISRLELVNTLGANPAGDVFTVMNHNLTRFGGAGDVDTLLNGTTFAFGAPGSDVSAVHALADGTWIMNVMLWGDMNVTHRLFKYFWDETATIDPNQTLTVWALEDNAVVRAAITEVSRLFPESDITFEIALNEDAGISVTDAVRTLNTQLLSGRGPDIIILDGIPADSYANRGMLLDMTGLVETGGIFANLLAPYNANGALYMLPTQFTIPMLIGSEAHLQAASTLTALVDKVVSGNPLPSMEALQLGRALGGTDEAERAAIGFNDLDELFHILWQANGAALIRDNQLDAAALTQFFSALLAISDKYELSQESDSMVMGGVFVAVGGGGGSSRANMLGGSLMNYMMHNTHLAVFEAANPMLLYSFMNRDGSELALFPGLVPGVWTPATLVGISADTRVADFAVAFVNALLSPAVQNMNHGVGLPVVSQSLQWQIDVINEQFEEMEMPLFEVDMDGFIRQLQTPSLIETTLHDMIWQTAERLAAGRLTVEGAVQEVEQNIRNYLAERA